MSHSHTPARTLPKTPTPRTLIKNTGLELLQKVRSRAASSSVSSRSRLGTDGIAPNKSQQKRAAGRPWLVEQRRHHSCEVWGDPLSKPQGHQQAGYRQKGEQSWNDGLGTQGQGLRRSGPDLSRVRQKPHQNAAEHQTGKRQIARFHTHHQKRLCAKAGKFASFFA